MHVNQLESLDKNEVVIEKTAENVEKSFSSSSAGDTKTTEPSLLPNSSQSKMTGAITSAILPTNETRAVEIAVAVSAVKPPTGPPANYSSRRTWVTTERMNELRRRAQDALKQNRTFTIRGCFSSVRQALEMRGWVEKLDLHRKHIPTGVCQVNYDDLAQGLPKRKPGETRNQYIAKCERNIMSRFLEHMPIDFLWTNRKEKCDYIDQAKNPGMTINKFHRAPFTSKEGLCMQLKDFHWFYEEGTAEMYFPRCYNVWSPEELNEFIENFKLTACIAFLRWLVDKYSEHGYEAVFSPIGKIPLSSIDFAFKRCTEFIENCQHNDIDNEDQSKTWEHEWDAFLGQHQQLTGEGIKIFSEQQHHRVVDTVIRSSMQLLENVQNYWPQYSLDGYNNLWIVKPANKCRGRGIQLMDNLKKILNIVNPSIASKSRFVVQKYIERPLIIHRTKFDIRQWFLVTNVHPMVIWMYKESYLRFSSQEYSLSNHHESVHLTNHAVQKRYTNGKRDKRLPNENMWDCYSFQAYLRQIGKHELWEERIFPGMRKAIIGTMLASQDHMDRRPNAFELFGADFMISEDFYPWLIEINSSPDLGATTSVTARMCPQCLEDVIKVVIDRRLDIKADVGNFELVYRQLVPPTPAYMGLNLLLKGKQLISKVNHHQHGFYFQRKERTLSQNHSFRQRTALIPAISNVHRVMPTFNATEYIEKCIAEATTGSVSSMGAGPTNTVSVTMNSIQQQSSPLQTLNSARRRIVALAATSTITPCTPNMLRTPRYATVNAYVQRRRSFAGSTRDQPMVNNSNRKTGGEIPNTDEQTTAVPTKRFRSCGPRLNTKSTKANNNNNEQSIKVIIQKCTIQKSQQHSPREQQQRDSSSSSGSIIKNSSNLADATDSRSEFSNTTSGGGFIGKENVHNSGQQPPRISPRLLGKLRSNCAQQFSLRNPICLQDKKSFRPAAVITENLTTSMTTSEGKSLTDCASVTKLSKPEGKQQQPQQQQHARGCNTIDHPGGPGLEILTSKQQANVTNTPATSIHAVGKKLRSWQSSRNLIRPPPAKPLSAYVGKEPKTPDPSTDPVDGISSIASTITVTARVKNKISPKRMRRRTRSEIVCRNTRC